MRVSVFLAWLAFAIMTDILSLIPYVGLVFSWPFTLLFAIYKYFSKVNFSKTIWVTAVDFLAEGIFSSLPANTLDVVLTYVLSMGQEKVENLAGNGEK